MADDQDTQRAEQERLKSQEGGAGQGAEQAGLAQNDQFGGGLGQTQTGYGGQNTDTTPTAGEPDTVAHNAEVQSSQGVSVRTDNIGPSPTGQGQARSATTGGPDLSKGLSDSNRGGGSTF